MLRIGIAASKMAKGNLWTYNLFVVLLSCVFALFLFLICGFSILVIVFLLSLGLHALRPADFHAGWQHMFKICLIVLALVIGILNSVAIIKNIQFTKNKI
jgi:high-affinity Fe2+/Pb2+ permease